MYTFSPFSLPLVRMKDSYFTFSIKIFNELLECWSQPIERINDCFN
ncbi:hypothetical protein KAM260_16740 [Klebsiella pneumoniae]|nr:hypothetical protein KAM260_16740 [Klebsiella pneumoniae]